MEDSGNAQKNSTTRTLLFIQSLVCTPCMSEWFHLRCRDRIVSCFSKWIELNPYIGMLPKWPSFLDELCIVFGWVLYIMQARKAYPPKAEWLVCLRHEQGHDLHHPDGYRGLFFQRQNQDLIGQGKNPPSAHHIFQQFFDFSSKQKVNHNNTTKISSQTSLNQQNIQKETSPNQHVVDMHLFSPGNPNKKTERDIKSHVEKPSPPNQWTMPLSLDDSLLGLEGWKIWNFAADV